MKSKMVSHTVESLPTVSDERLAEMKQLATFSDEEIDSGEIPRLTPQQLRQSFPGILRRFFRTHLMTRADADVILWLREKQDGGEEMVNALLRREMEKERVGKKQAA